ncbi:MAG: hypothetical protein AAGB97_03525 [Dehalococcoidia bacterium]
MIRKLDRLVRKLNRLHPYMAVSYWVGRDSYRGAVINKDGKNVLIERIILFLGILGVLLGATYWGALKFRAWAAEAGIIDVIGVFYYTHGFPLLAIGSLLLAAYLLLIPVLMEEAAGWVPLRFLLITERDLSFYKGFTLLQSSFVIPVLLGFLLLFFGKVVWRQDLADFFSSGLVMLLVVISFCILGNLLMSLVVMCIPPRLKRRVLFGLEILSAVLLVAVPFYFVRWWVGDVEVLITRVLDIVINPYVPTAWGMELFFLVQEKGWLAQESLMRLGWLIGLGLAGGVALCQIWHLTYRLE